MKKWLGVLIIIILILIIGSLLIRYECDDNLNTRFCKLSLFGIEIHKSLKQLEYVPVCENLSFSEVQECCKENYLNKNQNIPSAEGCNIGEWEVVEGMCFWVCNRSIGSAEN